MFFSMKGFRLLLFLSSALTAVVLIYVDVDLADQDIVPYLGLAGNRYY